MKLFEKQKLSRRRHQNINKISLSTNQQFSLFIIRDQSGFMLESTINLVDSYMKIINKTTRDLVPKIIMHFVINNVREFIKNEIIAYIYSSGDQASLMEESADEALKRDETLRIYHSTKDALKIIGDVARDTISEATPQPARTYDSLPAPSIIK